MPEAHAKSQRYKVFEIFLSASASLGELCLGNISLTITKVSLIAPKTAL
jgi:hypothetical protein